MKPFKEMTLQEQLEWVNSIGSHVVPGTEDTMRVYNPQTEPVTKLMPRDIGDLLDVLAGYLERDIAAGWDKRETA